jgi:pimeloyl-ACP methyl ester carboxylesterase
MGAAGGRTRERRSPGAAPPGALASWAFYEDLLAEPSIREAPIRFIATTLPGFGGTAPPDDLSMENYSKLASGLAADLSCDVVVGHSLGANVAIEIVSASEFSGPVVLLSPSFSRQDESKFPRALDRLSRVFRSSALLAHAEGHRPRDEEQLAARSA